MLFYNLHIKYMFFLQIIVYYVMRSKNEVLRGAAAGRLAAERSEADKLAKAHETIFGLTRF
jgi:hypothetical protein